MTHKRQKQRSNVQRTESLQSMNLNLCNRSRSHLLEIYYFALTRYFCIADGKFAAELIIFKKFYSQQGENETKKNLHLKPHEFLVNYLFIIDLCHQYGTFMAKMEIVS